VAAENDAAQDGDAAKCLPEAPDCEPGGSDVDPALGACISEDDPNYNPDEPCSDTGANTDGDALGMCAPGFTDCVDMVVDPMCIEGTDDCDDTVDGGDGAGSDGCDPDNVAACAVRVNEIVIVDMETNIGSVASIVTSEYVEWPNSCLGVETEGVVCAEVITPGFKIVAEAGGQQVEYHTDIKGGFVLAE